ncbi:MAG: helix-turn-helix domain-containing protein [Candidatus Rokubacteria bacterium]|nr:helix-turn-helix domain-containing protein [Candidatus Rokubacteria bacterium]
MQTTTRLYTVREIAEATRLSERAIRAALADGRLRALRPGGLRRVRISEHELQRFIETRPERRS